MHTNLSDTETYAHQRNRKSSAKLLHALIVHHGQEETKADDDALVEVLEAAIPKEPWFSIVGEIEQPVEQSPTKPAYPFVSDIQRIVAKYYGITRLDMLSPRRSAKIAAPRQVAYYLSKTLTPNTLPTIGRLFGGRDHTSVLYGVRKITQLKDTDAKLAVALQTLSAQLSA